MYYIFCITNSKNIFFLYLISIPDFAIFGISAKNTEEYRKYWNFLFLWKQTNKHTFVDSFAENVVHLDIFGTSGIILKFLVQYIELQYWNFFGIQ